MILQNLYIWRNSVKRTESEIRFAISSINGYLREGYGQINEWGNVKKNCSGNSIPGPG